MSRADYLSAGQRPRLTVSILTRNSEPRLASLLRELSTFADEVVVGVDASSTDGTLDIARENADVVFRFAHSEQLAPARMLPFRYASGDWILSLDDDESIDDAFETVAAELLSSGLVTHYWFKRKCIVSLDPCEFLYVSPWYPDWQLRLFRNDIRLVWKPPIPHSGYQVLGPGFREERVSILHFEPMILSDNARSEKLAAYRKAGADPASEAQLVPRGANVPRRRTHLRGDLHALSRRRAATYDPVIHQPTMPAKKPWGAMFLGCDMPTVVEGRKPFLAEIHVRNTGILTWLPRMGGLREAHLSLSCHLRAADGRLLEFDGPRFPMPRLVEPGGDVTFVCEHPGLRKAGSYQIEWDLVSEGEAWFHELGCKSLVSPISVTRAPTRAAGSPRSLGDRIKGYVAKWRQ